MKIEKFMNIIYSEKRLRQIYSEFDLRDLIEYYESLNEPLRNTPIYISVVIDEILKQTKRLL